jgi:DNA polymerase sigma
MREQLRAASISKLNEELQEISDRISEEANEYHDRRVIAFQRIQFLLQYYNVPIKLFGSCASGIAVRNSDIDIAVDNSILMYMDFLPENEKIRASLEKLEELFLTQPWITEIKFIKTAAIPLIKLTVDTRLPFFDPSIGEMYFELNRAHNCGPINADITIETKNKSEECSHLGLISTNTINRWIGEISSLHSIIIILKEFFGKKRLNCTYEGGLNTFSMIVLLVAFVFHARLEQEDNAAEVFYQFLRFYGEQFDEKERGVDLLNRDSSNIFYIKNLVNVEGVSAKLGKQGKQKADLEIKDPLNQQKNMTRNCYSFPQIKRLFRLLVENCFVRAENELEQLLSTRQEGKSALLQLNREAFAKRNVFIEFLNSVDLLF